MASGAEAVRAWVLALAGYAAAGLVKSKKKAKPF